MRRGFGVIAKVYEGEAGVSYLRIKDETARKLIRNLCFNTRIVTFNDLIARCLYLFRYGLYHPSKPALFVPANLIDVDWNKWRE